MKEEEGEIALKISLLFFDHLIIGGGSLVGNLFIYRMSKDEPGTLQKLCREGLIIPLLRNKKGKDVAADDLVDLAVSMRDRGTKHSFDHPQKMVDIAEFMAREKLQCLFTNDDRFQRCYNLLLKSFIEAKIYEIEAIYGSTESLKLLAKKFEGDLTRKSYPFDTMSSFYSHVESTCDQETSLYLMKSAEFCAQYTSSSLNGVRLSTPKSIKDQTMILNRITKSRGDYYDPRHIEFSQGRFPTHLCLGSLLKFTVSEILEIRQTTGFIALRDTLRDFRKSGLIDEQELQERIRYCFGDLGALFNNGDGRKSDIMREMREKHIAREQYFMINRLNSAVESIGFIDSMTGLTGSVGTILMMIFTTGLKGVMRNREISAIYKNYEFDPSNSSKIDPESGLIELA